jgi:hypothetical protein
MAGHAAAVAARQSSPSLLNNKKPLVISIGHVQTLQCRGAAKETFKLTQILRQQGNENIMMTLMEKHISKLCFFRRL